MVPVKKEEKKRNYPSKVPKKNTPRRKSTASASPLCPVELEWSIY